MRKEKVACWWREDGGDGRLPVDDGSIVGAFLPRFVVGIEGGGCVVDGRGDANAKGCAELDTEYREVQQVRHTIFAVSITGIGRGGGGGRDGPGSGSKWRVVVGGGGRAALGGREGEVQEGFKVVTARCWKSGRGGGRRLVSVGALLTAGIVQLGNWVIVFLSAIAW